MELTDAAPLPRTLAHDPEAFGDVVDRYKHAVINYLTRLVGNRDRAEEIAQETFVRLYQRLGSTWDDGRLAAYLFKIATNLVRSEERRKRRWRLLRPLFPWGIEPEEPCHEPGPQHRLLASERQDRLRAALAELDLAHRAPLVLREIEGLSYQEVALALGLSEGTVKSRIHRGRQKLKELLSPYWNGGQ